MCKDIRYTGSLVQGIPHGKEIVLSLLLKREGIPNTMISMDGANKQVMGMFRRKCREAGIWVTQTEPYTPWSNAAETAIRELKKGVGRQMVRLKAPAKRLWDNCLEQEAYVRSLTAHDIYRLNGQVPETLVSNEIADISPCVAFKWYEWVLFRDTSVMYLNDTMVLGRNYRYRTSHDPQGLKGQR